MSAPAGPGPVSVSGPCFDDLALGERFAEVPPVTLTEGMAGVHHAIVGCRQRLVLDPRLSAQVAGPGPGLVSPVLAWDIAIGHSSIVTQQVIANLFYRGLVFHRLPRLGDRLSTVTSVVGLRGLAPKPDRPPRGLAVLRIETRDQDGRPVLDFKRCAMIAARRQPEPVASGETDPAAPALPAAELARAVAGWDLAAYRTMVPGPHFADLAAGAHWRLAIGDVVSAAPELARLTMNLAAIHYDRTATGDGERLVYGGHTIGIAAAQLNRVLPALVTILGWHGCDHLAPVHEGDTLHSEVALETLEPLPAGGGLAHLRVEATATRPDGSSAPVLDWRPIGLMA
jgi:acyl dehydratase